MELSEDELHVEEGEGAQGEHHDVGDEEGAAAVLVAEVREPPHVGQVHREPDDAERGKQCNLNLSPPSLQVTVAPSQT